jgi:hypothetical protein
MHVKHFYKSNLPESIFDTLNREIVRLSKKHNFEVFVVYLFEVSDCYDFKIIGFGEDSSFPTVTRFSIMRDYTL